MQGSHAHTLIHTFCVASFAAVQAAYVTGLQCPQTAYCSGRCSSWVLIGLHGALTFKSHVGTIWIRLATLTLLHPPLPSSPSPPPSISPPSLCFEFLFLLPPPLPPQGASSVPAFFSEDDSQSNDSSDSDSSSSQSDDVEQETFLVDEPLERTTGAAHANSAAQAPRSMQWAVRTTPSQRASGGAPSSTSTPAGQSPPPLINLPHIIILSFSLIHYTAFIYQSL